jgi:hypothetical protein
MAPADAESPFSFHDSDNPDAELEEFGFELYSPGSSALTANLLAANKENMVNPLTLPRGGSAFFSRRNVVLRPHGTSVTMAVPSIYLAPTTSLIAKKRALLMILARAFLICTINAPPCALTPKSCLESTQAKRHKQSFQVPGLLSGTLSLPAHNRRRIMAPTRRERETCRTFTSQIRPSALAAKRWGCGVVPSRSR